MNGIIIINKPTGITSFDVIYQLRKILKEKKIGHTGTLDPLAEGVLVVCVGRATRLAKNIEGYRKEYVAGFTLGRKTDTGDVLGKILKETKGFSVTMEALQKTSKSFIGKIKQRPPMFSALKRNGKKLYHLARNGIEIEREEREIEIEYLEILSFDGIVGTFKAMVSKGTYIRSLIDELGEKLETYAVMHALKRTRIETLTLDQAYTLDEITQMVEQKKIDFLIPVEQFFNHPPISLKTQKDYILFTNGNTVMIDGADSLYKIYFEEKFLGFGKINNNRLKGYQYF